MVKAYAGGLRKYLQFCIEARIWHTPKTPSHVYRIRQHDSRRGDAMTQGHTPASGQATTIKKLFSRQTSVAVDVAAPPAKIWSLLTDAEKFPSWTSTIIEITGIIAAGERILLRSTLAPTRTFKLRVKEFVPPHRLSWGDAMGTRTYTLENSAEGRTRFTMIEKIGGPLFPLFARMIPPFDQSFNQFAADLKAAAEGNA